ncbi:MAG TPA: YceI family protein [Candidatus Acidoferrales bacterium]
MAIASALSFSIDTQVSRFTVQAFASGFASVVAHDPKFAVRDFTGDVHLDPDNFGSYSVNASIRLRSLDLTDEVSEFDRSEIERVMFEEVLEVDSFPEATFTASGLTTDEISSNIYRAELKGQLCLHGRTQPLTFSTQVISGEDSIRAQGEIALNPSAFGIRLPSVARGVIKMKDHVKIGFFMIGRKP